MNWQQLGQSESRHEVRLRWLALAGLLVTCAMWGSSFSAIKICGEILVAGAAVTCPAFGPLMLTALRFAAALPLALLLFGRFAPWQLKRSDIRPLLQVGLAMTFGFLTQAAGLAWTTATVSAFLTSLTVCVVPVLEWFLLGRAPSLRLGLAVLLATAAVCIMTLPGTAGPSLGPGELLTLMCALGFSFQVLWTGEAARQVGVARLTLSGFLMTGAASWLCLLVLFPRGVQTATRSIVWGPQAVRFWRYFVWVVLGPTIGAMTMMNISQRYVRPTEAAVIYTTEPLFAAAFALLLRGRSELLGAAGLAGATLILVADLLAALPEQTPSGGVLQQQG